MGIGALIFDMDGLLFDTERLAAATWAEGARSLGFELSEDMLRGAVGLDHVLSRAYYHRLFEGRFPYDEVTKLHRELFRSHVRQKGVPVKPGVGDILDEAHGLGLRVALGTSSRAVYAHTMLWLAGIVERFHVLATRDLVQAGKPAPDIFLKAAHMLGVQPDTCLVFEDSHNGINAAHAAGMRVVMVPDLIEPTAELRAKCVAVMPSLSDAARALASLINEPCRA